MFTLKDYHARYFPIYVKMYYGEYLKDKVVEKKAKAKKT